MLVSTIILCALNIYCALGLLDLGTYNYLIAAGSGILLILAFIFFFKNFIGWLKTDFVCVVLIALFSWGYYLFVMFGLVKYLQDENALQELIQSTGIWSYLVYVLVQFLQVTFIPIPAMITTIAGTFLFGPGMASLLSLAGIFLGSFFAFFIGDKFGEKVVKWIVGEEKTKKYSNLLYDKGKYMFFLMMLFPIFPDDILCLVAGMTSMSYRFFTITILLTKLNLFIYFCQTCSRSFLQILIHLHSSFSHNFYNIVEFYICIAIFRNIFGIQITIICS